MTSLDESNRLHRGWTEQIPKREPLPASRRRATVEPGPPEAVLSDEANAADLAALLDEYRRDARFRLALVELADRLLAALGDGTTARAHADGWHAAAKALRSDERYVAAVTAFATRWKLDRLPVIGDDPAGLQALYAWLLPCFLGWQEDTAPTDADARTFGGGIVSGALVTTASTRATLPVTYDPTAETRAEAEARARVELARLLDEIESEHREAGYVFADTRHRRETHAAWLYQRLAYGQSYRAIADAWNADKAEAEQKDEEYVRKAVNRFATRLGICDLSAT